ncbi:MULTISPECIES: hypothetical protein [unclassified Methylobacterium]|uniref:hypothetical protein n=1 Tax=unclassified Methylobacterium TaxID=2615210 RepID=UPI0006F880AB|nr:MULTISPECIES: hypothetical protein [unclassified Methylobacterium]KQP52672.1 hypothetical protein ASF39_07130 [Methylobacterium sp. Leaf108]KQT84383.1 hypothetical protein ASG59_03105 [Methylobacterium sp. Leaf466]
MIDENKAAEPPPGKAPAPKKEPVNIAPDAVMDPNEKTDGKPGHGPKGEPSSDGETDPGGS